MVMASSGLAQPADSISVTAKAKPPQNTVITTVQLEDGLLGSSLIFPLGLLVSPDSSTVYVTGEDSEYGTTYVLVLDATNNYATKAIVSVGSFSEPPGYLATNPDGTTLYVSCAGTPGTVSVIDTTQPTYPVTATLTAGNTPAGMAVTPDGTALYVVNEGFRSTNTKGNVSVFDTSTNTLTATLQTGGYPLLCVFTASGNQLDLLNTAGSGYMQFINTASGTISGSTGAAGRIRYFYPAGLVTDSNASSLYIASQINYVTVCDSSDGRVIKQLLAQTDVSESVELGQPAVTPNGQYLYVPYAAGENQVVMLNIGTGKLVGSPIQVGNEPRLAQVAPNGDTLYVANYIDGSITVIDTTP
jgi:YVTN family beta-propeller protein